MPGKHIAGADEPCRRCKDSASVIVVRSEPLCHECFNRYVHTKCIKRLESFRVNFAAEKQRKILVPVSFGVSSLTLLHILDLHLKTQKLKTGRTGFQISVLLIQGPERDLQSELSFRNVQILYPDHEYATSPLHDVFRILPDDASIRGLLPRTDTASAIGPQEQFVSLINSLTSATARADVLTTLKTRLIVEHAKLSGCESVLWGDSTTRLAEKTLTETAKGRGFSLPWQTDDGDSPFGIKFHYPLRDVLKKELVSYIKMAETGLAELVTDSSSTAAQASMSSKNTTIDDLMKQYFESVEENFPSIVANVVRTTSKLKLPADAMLDPPCSLCSMPVPGGRFGIHGWGGDQHDGAEDLSIGSGSNVCYGCTRSLPKAIKANGI
ncbi:Cytoplasmic tRNA 2-thiolation protein 2 [Coniothyrium glycines]